MRRGPHELLLLALALGSVACDRPADPQWIASELERAHTRDQAARAEHTGDDERAAWTLQIVATDGRAETLAFAGLARLPQTEVTTLEPDEAGHPQTVHFSGVRISDLVQRAEGSEHAGDVTLLASDGFRATLAMDDVRRFPILLATDANGAPLGRDHGGPLYSVLPVTDHPELAERYTSSFWVFYVTHVVVGTAPPAIRVGSRELDAETLRALPITSLSAVVGYRTGWPSEPVVVQGVRVRDVLALAGVALGPDDQVRILSRASITRGQGRPTLVSASDVTSQDVILAMSYGEAAAPIPSRLGGPIALAFPESVAAHLTDHDWLTFVNELEVVHGSETP